MSHDAATPLEQASAIPYRIVGGGLEICLITSLASGRWGFPKGLIDPGETAIETALKEAYEEAGLHGRIVGAPVGEYRYAKWARMLSVVVYLMEVDGCLDAWPEAAQRQRRWTTPDEATRMLDRRPLARLFALALERLQGDG